MKNAAALAWRYIKVQKRHSFFIVVSVILSVALTVFALTMFASVSETMRRFYSTVEGDWHLCLTGLTLAQAEELSHNSAFSETNIVKCYSAAPYFRSWEASPEEIEKNSGYDSIFNYICINDMYDIHTRRIMSISESTGDSLLSVPKLIRGRLPVNDNEIVLPARYGVSEGKTVEITVTKIGDKIIVPETEEAPPETEQENICSYSKSYSVCGIADSSYLMSYPYIHSSDDFFDNEVCRENYYLYARVSDPSVNLHKFITELCSRSGIELNSFGNAFNDFASRDGVCCTLHNDLLKCEAVGSEARSELVEKLAIMYIVVLLILFSGRMIIDCEFELTSQKKQEHMGLLMFIGADDRQLVSVTTLEGVILGIIAVPLGLLLGCGVCAGVCSAVAGIKNIDYLLESSSIISLKINPLYLLLAAVTGIGWVFFSAYGTAVRIKRVNPIEAARGYLKSGRLPYKKKIALKKAGKAGNAKLTPRSFMNSIALNSLRINKKRTVSSVIAVMNSMLLFVTLNYSFDMYEDCTGKVRNYDNNNRIGLGEHICLNLYASINERISLNKEIMGSGLFETELSDIYSYFSNIMLFEESGKYSGTVGVIDREGFESFSGCGITYDEMNSTNSVLIAKNIHMSQKDTDKNGDSDREDLPAFENGQALEMNLRMFDHHFKMNTDVTGKELPLLKCNAFVPQIDMGTEWQNVYITEEMFHNYVDYCIEEYPEYFNVRFTGGMVLYLIDENCHDKAAEWLESKGITFIDYYGNAYSEAAAASILKIISGAIIIVAALIALSNIVNITVSGINENRKGFALLRAAGMTDRQLEKTAALHLLVPVAAASVLSLALTIIFAFIVSRTVTGTLGVNEEYLNEMKAAGIRTVLYGSLIKHYLIAAASAFAAAFLASVFTVKEIEEIPAAEAVKTSE